VEEEEDDEKKKKKKKKGGKKKERKKTENERKQEMLVGILKEVTSSCNHCKVEVAKRLSQITGIVEPIIISEEAKDA
jgi:ribosomal protein S25